MSDFENKAAAEALIKENIIEHLPHSKIVRVHLWEPDESQFLRDLFPDETDGSVNQNIDKYGLDGNLEDAASLMQHIEWALNYYVEIGIIDDYVFVDDILSSGNINSPDLSIGVSDFNTAADGFTGDSNNDDLDLDREPIIILDHKYVEDNVDPNETRHVLLHEMAHAFGLTDVSNILSELPDSKYDNKKYSIMSYVNHNDIDELPLSFMLLDYWAFDQAGLLNSPYEEGTSTYFWDKDDEVVSTIYDTGGLDVISAEGHDTRAVIDLRQGHFSSYGQGTPTENLAIAYGTIIENAIGGEKDDVLIGNIYRNHLEGGEGNDILYGDASSYDVNADNWSYGLFEAGRVRVTVYGSQVGDGAYDSNDVDIENDNDILEGGEGDDSLYGGRGEDTYNFAVSSFGKDTIIDDDGFLEIDGEIIGQDSASLDGYALVKETADEVYTLFHNGTEFTLTYTGTDDADLEIANGNDSITIKGFENGTFGLALIDEVWIQSVASSNVDSLNLTPLAQGGFLESLSEYIDNSDEIFTKLYVQKYSADGEVVGAKVLVDNPLTNSLEAPLSGQIVNTSTTPYKKTELGLTIFPYVDGQYLTTWNASASYDFTFLKYNQSSNEYNLYNSSYSKDSYMGRLFDSNGHSIGDEFEIGYTLSVSHNPSDPNEAIVETDNGLSLGVSNQSIKLSDGKIVIAGVALGKNYNEYGDFINHEFHVYNQLVNSNGTKSGNLIYQQVALSFDRLTFPTSISPLDNGGYLIDYFSESIFPSNTSIYSQRYNNDGTEFGSNLFFEFETGLSNAGISNSLLLDNSTYFIAWNFQPSTELIGTILNDNGNRLIEDFVIANNSTLVATTKLSNGEIVVVWGVNEGNNINEIRGKRFDSTGNPLSHEFFIQEVSSQTYSPGALNIIANVDGSFTVTLPTSSANYPGAQYLSKTFPSGFLALDDSSDDETTMGTDGNDILTGTDLDETIEGGLGDDSLEGGAGFDTYVYNRGDGTDTIQDSGSNKLTFTDINLSELSIEVGSLILNITGTDESIRLLGFDANDPEAGAGITEFEFADGTIKTLDEILAIGFQYQGTSSDDTINGTNSRDIILGLAGNDLLDGISGSDDIFGGEGDDIIIAGAGSDKLYGGAGDDEIIDSGGELNFIYGGSGIDTITISNGSNSEIYGEDDRDYITTTGNDSDLIYAGAGNDSIDINFGINPIVFGGEGDDFIKYDSDTSGSYINGGPGNDIIGMDSFSYNTIVQPHTLIGGPGRDEYFNFGGQYTIIFNRGDGLDKIIDMETLTPDAVEYGPGITQSDLRVTTQWNDLYINILNPNDSNADDRIIVKFANSSSAYGPELYKFSDGSTLTGEQMSSLQHTLHGTSGDDILLGTSNDNILIGHEGSDTLKGGAGDDKYQFSLGDGSDTIDNTTANANDSDSLELLNGITTDQLFFSQIGNDLEIELLDSTDSITVLDAFSTAENQIDEINVGTEVLLSNQLGQLVAALSSFSPDSANGGVYTQEERDDISVIVAASFQTA